MFILNLVLPCCGTKKTFLYSYRLNKEGTEGKWGQPSFQTSVSYAALPPGKYSFEVKALVNNSVWSNPPAVWRFTIQKPFWQTEWFYVLTGLFVLAAAYFMIREIIYRTLKSSDFRWKNKMQ
jgi:hypothetical protein